MTSTTAFRLFTPALYPYTPCCRVGTANVLDLSLAEEPCAQSTLHVAVDATGRVCGVTKQGMRGIDPATTAAMLEVAQATAPRLVASLRKHLAAVAATSDGA
eukprot:140068-Chlamydomonas_euryale.AAC.10